jgi:hypothetical protein
VKALKQKINRTISKALPFAIFFYLALIAFQIIGRAQRVELDIYNLDKRVSILESREQDRRDNNTLLWTLIGGSALNMVMTGFMLKAKK